MSGYLFFIFLTIGVLAVIAGILNITCFDMEKNKNLFKIHGVCIALYMCCALGCVISGIIWFVVNFHWIASFFTSP